MFIKKKNHLFLLYINLPTLRQRYTSFIHVKHDTVTTSFPIVGHISISYHMLDNRKSLENKGKYDTHPARRGRQLVLIKMQYKKCTAGHQNLHDV